MSLTDEQRQKIADYVRSYLFRTAHGSGNRSATYRATTRWMHSLNVCHNLNLILEGEHASAETRAICEVAALFHDIDHYTVPQEYHAVRGAETATHFLRKEGYPQEFIIRVADAIREHNRDLDDVLPIEQQVEEIIHTLSHEARMVMDADTLDKIGASNILQSLTTMGLSKQTVAEAANELTSGWPLQRARLWKEMLTTPTGRVLGAQRLAFYEQFLEQIKAEVVINDPYMQDQATLETAQV